MTDRGFLLWGAFWLLVAWRADESGHHLMATIVGSYVVARAVARWEAP